MTIIDKIMNSDHDKQQRKPPVPLTSRELDYPGNVAEVIRAEIFPPSKNQKNS